MRGGELLPEDGGLPTEPRPLRIKQELFTWAADKAHKDDTTGGDAMKGWAQQMQGCVPLQRKNAEKTTLESDGLGKTTLGCDTTEKTALAGGHGGKTTTTTPPPSRDSSSDRKNTAQLPKKTKVTRPKTKAQKVVRNRGRL